MRALFASSLAVIVIACTASEPPSDPPARTETAPTNPIPKPDSGPPADAGAVDAAPQKNECKLAELADVADITPTFVLHAPPDVVPAAMTGGTLAGEYVVDKATVFLPSGAAGLVDPALSTGTINAWAVFDGTNYRLHLKANLTIDTVAGAQSQAVDTSSQGAFKVSTEALTLDHACDTAIVDEADYSFTDDGSDRATILIKTPSPYGDTYLQLDATKN